MNKKNIYIFIYKMSTIVVQQIMSQKKSEQKCTVYYSKYNQDDVLRVKSVNNVPFTISHDVFKPPKCFPYSFRFKFFLSVLYCNYFFFSRFYFSSLLLLFVLFLFLFPSASNCRGKYFF